MIFIYDAGELLLCRPRMMHDISVKKLCGEFCLYVLWGRKDQHDVHLVHETNLTFPPNGTSSSKHNKCWQL